MWKLVFARLVSLCLATLSWLCSIVDLRGDANEQRGCDIFSLPEICRDKTKAKRGKKSKIENVVV